MRGRRQGNWGAAARNFALIRVKLTACYLRSDTNQAGRIAQLAKIMGILSSPKNWLFRFALEIVLQHNSVTGLAALEMFQGVVNLRHRHLLNHRSDGMPTAEVKHLGC